MSSLPPLQELLELYPAWQNDLSSLSTRVTRAVPCLAECLSFLLYKSYWSCTLPGRMSSLPSLQELLELYPAWQNVFPSSSTRECLPFLLYKSYKSCTLPGRMTSLPPLQELLELYHAWQNVFPSFFVLC